MDKELVKTVVETVVARTLMPYIFEEITPVQMDQIESEVKVALSEALYHDYDLNVTWCNDGVITFNIDYLGTVYTATAQGKPAHFSDLT